MAKRRAPRLVVWLPLLFVFAVIFCALFAPLLAPFSPDLVQPERALEAASARHWLGTDEDGADLLTQLIYGARVAVIVGFGTVAVSTLVGLLVGLPSGYFGGWIDEVLMRIAEVLLSFPGILLAIIVIFLTAQPSEFTVIAALSLTGWASYARLVRGQVLSLRERDWVAAARSLGASHARIMVVHLLPNAVPPLLVQATFGVASAVLAEASLSFLGLGPQGTASWGALLDQGAVLFLVTPTVAVSAGLAIALLVLSVTLLGDALRERLDPHSRPRLP
jgi:peptide/nickel transport system permease protein